MEKKYTNNTNEFQLIGNCEDVIFSGSEKETKDRFDKFNVELSKYAVISILQPGKSMSCDFVEPKETRETTENDFWNLFE